MRTEELAAARGTEGSVEPARSVKEDATWAARHSYFDAIYSTTDPYGTGSRWYERRKRRLLLDALPRERFRRAFEPACGTGELTRELAARCDQVLASDFCAAAVHQARLRNCQAPHVTFAVHRMPMDWPAVQGPFDLIVVSELCSFLDAGEAMQLAKHCAASLSPDGVVVACDWRWPFDARVLDAGVAHRLLDGVGLHPLVSHQEEDFLLKVWSQDGASVATREGLVD